MFPTALSLGKRGRPCRSAARLPGVRDRKAR